MPLQSQTRSVATAKSRSRRIGRLSAVQRLINTFLYGMFGFWIALGPHLLSPPMAHAHYVAQTMQKFTLAPESIALLSQRVQDGDNGFLPGDEVSYIASFTTSGTTEGSGGYVTFYVPDGTVVTAADFVEPDGNGSFVQVVPRLPGGIDAGWGDVGNTSFVGDTAWTTSDADTIAACSAAGYSGVENCPGTLAQAYADTGVFYANDPRTAFFAHPTPEQPSALRATDDNGYNIDPSIGSDVDSHNLWDTLGVEAFSGTASPTEYHTPYLNFGNSRGNTPYNTGSVVGGPDAGYKLDYSGQVGPWKRAQYPGSLMGNPKGPAIASDVEFNNPLTGTQVVMGEPTSSGTPFPLPPDTNAVRISIGMLRDAETNYARLTLQLGSDVGAAFLVNSEVVGGDAGGISDGKDAVWRYFQPSVALSQADLFLSKTASAQFVLPGESVDYTITAYNGGFWEATNVVVTDTLPTGDFSYGSTAATVLHQPDGSTTALSPSINTTGQTVSWDFGSLVESYGAYITIDFDAAVDINAPPGDALYANTIEATYFDRLATATAGPVSTAPVQIVENLIATKTVTPESVDPGDTVTYTIDVRNVGTDTVTDLQVRDFLPTSGGTDSAGRFSFVPGSSQISGMATAAPTVVSPPTIAPYSGENREEIFWDFADNQALAPGDRFTIQLQAVVGTSVGGSEYANDFQIDYVAQGQKTYRKTDTAPVTVSQPLTVSTAVTPDTVILGQSATYQITVENTSTANLTDIVVYDFLPFDSAGSSATDRFELVSGSSQFSGISSVSPAVGVPTQAPYTGNSNQQQIAWDFAGQTLAPGDRFTITFKAVVGEDMAIAPYPNNLKVSYQLNSLSLASELTDVTPVNVVTPPPPVMTQSVTPENAFSGDTVTYQIVVTNPSDSELSDVVIYDFLPTNGGSDDDATNRFSYVPDSTTVTIINDPSGKLEFDKIELDTPPKEPPYDDEENREQIAWKMKNEMVVGAEFVIEFQAVVGTNVPDGIYRNELGGEHKEAAELVGALNEAIVTVGNPVSNDPQLLLVKRLSAINGSTISRTVDGAEATDNNAFWPEPIDSSSGISAFLAGDISRSDIQSGDELEYTIYFLSGGNVPITNVHICDVVPTNTTFVPGSISLKFGNAATASAAGRVLTNGSAAPCPAVTGASNYVVVVDLADNTLGEALPPMSAAGTPAEAYGYVRFRVTVNNELSNS